MATTNIVQYLNHTGKSVTTGASVELGTSPLDRLQYETFLTESAIVKGQAVSLDLSKIAADPTGGFAALTVIAAVGNVATKKCVVGIAAQSVTGTATSPQPVTVIVRGPALLVPATGAIAQGAGVVVDSGGGLGAVETAAAGSLTNHVGVAMSAAAAGFVTIYVLGSGI